MKIAIVHDWLTGMRGGEKCLEVFCELFPSADIFSILYVEGTVSPVIEKMNIRTSFIQKLPFAKTRYRHYLPLFPRAIESFDFTGYDLIFSSSHCVAKGAVSPDGATHICYCYTPMRYVWDMYDQYFGEERTNVLTRPIFHHMAKRLRRWDASTSDRVDQFVAISGYVAERIKRCYKRDSTVIYPPADCAAFQISDTQEDFFLMVSAFAPYKRVDIAVEAFGQLGLPLKVIGTGQDEKRLKKMAVGNVEFLGWQPDEFVSEAYSKCQAFIFPGEEDFGITPVEAMASGRPVIAYAGGGALETVVPMNREELPPGLQDAVLKDGAPTGVLFAEQTSESLVGAIRYFEQHAADFDPQQIRRHAMRFDRTRFKEEIAATISDYCPVAAQR